MVRSLPTALSQPVSLEPSRGAEAMGDCRGEGFNASAPPWLLPSPVGHLNGTVGWAAASGSLFSACQRPGYRGEGLPAGGKQAERWAIVAPEAPPPFLVPGPLIFQASPSTSKKCAFPLNESGYKSEG